MKKAIQTVLEAVTIARNHNLPFENFLELAKASQGPDDLKAAIEAAVQAPDNNSERKPAITICSRRDEILTIDIDRIEATFFAKTSGVIVLKSGAILILSVTTHTVAFPEIAVTKEHLEEVQFALTT